MKREIHYLYIRNRCLKVAKLILEGKTVREVAKILNVGKSTVESDLNKRLKNIDLEKYEGIRQIIEDRKRVRHLLGGKSMREKNVLNTISAKPFGTNLKLLREKKGYSQQQLASFVGVREWTIAQWETGRFFPSQGKIRQLVECLGTTKEDLLSA